MAKCRNCFAELSACELMMGDERRIDRDMMGDERRVDRAECTCRKKPARRKRRDLSHMTAEEKLEHFRVQNQVRVARCRANQRERERREEEEERRNCPRCSMEGGNGGERAMEGANGGERARGGDRAPADRAPAMEGANGGERARARRNVDNDR